MSDWADVKAAEIINANSEVKKWGIVMETGPFAQALREVAEREYRKGFQAGVIYEQKTRRSVSNQKGWGYSE